MKQQVLFIFGLLICNIAVSQTWETDRARLQPDGSLTYQEDADQNRIPDFSNAGYKGGGVAIPFVETRLTIAPIEGDNTDHIQDAIDQVSEMEPDADGFRGAVLLETGRYPVSGQLFVHTSGVVLRGISDGRDSQDTTVIFGTGNIPHQRDLIVIGGGDETRWRGEVDGSRQEITNDFVQVGSHSFEIADASGYDVGDNIIITHPCSAEWLAAIDGGATAGDADWSVDQYPILYNRYITAISSNEITVDAPVYNHLDRSLAQSYIYEYDRAGLVTQVGIENVNVQIESLGGSDENHIWNAVQFTQVEDAWAINATVSGYGLSGIRTSTASRISVVNVHSIDPVAQVTGARMYNFNTYRNSNGILFDNCYARNGRHHYVSNGTSTASGIVFLRSISEHPKSTSEGHRHWTTGMLYDNMIDIGSFPSNGTVLALYNRGDFGTGHGWSAAHSVLWNCEVDRPGGDASIVVEQPPTAQNYAIGCKGNVGVEGPFSHPTGYIEGANNDDQLIPVSLYEAQLLHRTETVISDFEASETVVEPDDILTFTAKVQGNVSSYIWDFGTDAIPSVMTGVGPHDVSYTSAGLKTITLTVSDGISTHSETKTAYIIVRNSDLVAIDDDVAVEPNGSITVPVLNNDILPFGSERESFLFDGDNDNVVYESDRIIQSYPFTMMAWFSTTNSDVQTILYIGNANSNFTGNTLSVRDGRPVLEASLWNGSSSEIQTITGDESVTDGEWHHIAGVFVSPTERHLYVDGNLSVSDDVEQDNVTPRLWRFAVGNREDSTPNDDWVDGLIDEVRIYTSALSETELSDVMSGSTCDDLEQLLYWNFGGQLSNIVIDQFGFLDGTNSGATSVESTLSAGAINIDILNPPNHGSAFVSNDNEIVYTPDPDYVGLDTLTYELMTADCNSSEANIVFLVDEISSVDETDLSEILVYPNPTTAIVNIEVEDVRSIKLYSTVGNLVYSTTSQRQIDLSNLYDGAYIIVVETLDRKIYSQKVIKY